MSDVIVAPETRDLAQLSEQLARWLPKMLPHAVDIRLAHFDYPRGAGQSHETILFDASWQEKGARRTQGFVVRIKPTRHTVYPDDLFEEQYRIMRVLYDQGHVRIARLMAYEADAGILGAPFFVMEKKIGRVAVSIPPYSQTGWVADATPTQRRKLWENGVRQLAAIQSTPLSGLDFLRGRTRGAEQGLEQEWDKYIQFIAWLERDQPWPVLHRGAERLRAKWPKNQPPGLVWGDARIGNMMFDEDFEVIAVMDWEQPSLGGALHDLAWWLFNARAMHSGEEPGRPFLPGMGSREETIALWHEITGIPTDDIEWYERIHGAEVRVSGDPHELAAGLPDTDGGGAREAPTSRIGRSQHDDTHNRFGGTNMSKSSATREEDVPPGGIVAPEVRDLDVLKSQLATWLATRVAGAEEVRIENLAYPQGAGRSHETILFDASWACGGQRVHRACVVRIKPTRHTVFPDNLFEQQYRVMQVLHEQGHVRVARPLWFEADAALLGAPFFVMERVRGRVPVSVPPYAQVGWVVEATPAQRAKMWENGVRQLAAIQRTPRDTVAFLRGAEGAREGLEQEWDKYVRFVEWISQDHRWPALDHCLARLRASWPKNQPPGLVWGDARLGNMMFDDQFEVVAVMDWEQPSLGGALQDLAWWLVLSETMHGATPTRPHLAGMGTRADTIALWSEITGISAAGIEWYEDFTHLKMSCTGVRLAQLGKMPFPDEAWLAKRLRVDGG